MFSLKSICELQSSEIFIFAAGASDFQVLFPAPLKDLLVNTPSKSIIHTFNKSCFPEVFCKKVALKKFLEMHRKIHVPESFFNEVDTLRISLFFNVPHIETR